jgi:hypothetical protein
MDPKEILKNEYVLLTKNTSGLHLYTRFYLNKQEWKKIVTLVNRFTPWNLGRKYYCEIGIWDMVILIPILWCDVTVCSSLVIQFNLLYTSKKRVCLPVYEKYLLLYIDFLEKHKWFFACCQMPKEVHKNRMHVWNFFVWKEI